MVLLQHFNGFATGFQWFCIQNSLNSQGSENYDARDDLFLFFKFGKVKY